MNLIVESNHVWKFLELIKKRENYYSQNNLIDINKIITPTKAQKNVIFRKFHNGFNVCNDLVRRQSGLSLSIIVKALYLSNFKRIKIAIIKASFSQIEYLYRKLIDILNRLNYEYDCSNSIGKIKVTLKNGSEIYFLNCGRIEFSNGSSIESFNFRGYRFDYIFIDDVSPYCDLDKLKKYFMPLIYNQNVGQVIAFIKRGM